MEWALLIVGVLTFAVVWGLHDRLTAMRNELAERGLLSRKERRVE